MESIVPKTSGYIPKDNVSASVPPTTPGVATAPQAPQAPPKPEAKPPENAEKVPAKGNEQPMTKEEVTEVVDALQSMSTTLQTQLMFSVHEENDQIVIKVMDKASKKLIRQFPSEEMLALQDKMKDLSGLLFDQNI